MRSRVQVSLPLPKNQGVTTICNSFSFSFGTQFTHKSADFLRIRTSQNNEIPGAKICILAPLCPLVLHTRRTAGTRLRGSRPSEGFAVFASGVEGVASVHRRVERREFAVPRPFPESISASRQIPGPPDGLGLRQELPQRVAVDGEFVDHISALLSRAHILSTMESAASFMISSNAPYIALLNPSFTLSTSVGEYSRSVISDTSPSKLDNLRYTPRYPAVVGLNFAFFKSSIVISIYCYKVFHFERPPTGSLDVVILDRATIVRASGAFDRGGDVPQRSASSAQRAVGLFVGKSHYPSPHPIRQSVELPRLRKTYGEGFARRAEQRPGSAHDYL
nr:MAG TPA: hypothetical protein [Caudoviricetes sp.]